MREPNYSASTEEPPCSSELPPIERLANRYGVPISEVIPLIGTNELDTAKNIRDWIATREPSNRSGIGHRRRYGYDADGIPIIEEQQVIAQIALMWCGGIPVTDITKKVNADGHLTASGRKWSVANIYHLIRGIGYDRDSA